MEKLADAGQPYGALPGRIATGPSGDTPEYEEVASTSSPRRPRAIARPRADPGAARGAASEPAMLAGCAAGCWLPRGSVRGQHVVYGLERGRIAYLAIVPRKQTARPLRLARQLRALGLRR